MSEFFSPIDAELRFECDTLEESVAQLKGILDHIPKIHRVVQEQIPIAVSWLEQQRNDPVREHRTGVNPIRTIVDGVKVLTAAARQFEQGMEFCRGALRDDVAALEKAIGALEKFSETEN